LNSPKRRSSAANAAAEAVAPNSGNCAAQPNHGAIRGSVVLLGCDPAGLPIVSASVVIERSGRLKFLVGLDASDRLVIVFDDVVDQHADLAKLHDLRPLGGGWIEVDLAEKRLRLIGGSLTFGREPDRELTIKMLSQALPEFVCGIGRIDAPIK
jgi:hypothetical protein